MAENKEININIKQNADKAEKSFNSYNKELKKTKNAYDAVLKSGKPFDQQLEDINRIVKETPLNVRDMNKQIQAYQSIALSAGRETPVGRKALEEAAALRDRYVDIQNETKRLADDQKTLEGAMQGVATGVAVYGGIQSAMALSGVESEKLRETLVKLQAAQTLMNSINQVATAFEKESALMLTLKSAKTKAVTVATAAYATVTGTTTGALKLFRIALASTGIGALIVGIGLLIANFEKLIGVFDPVIQGLKDFADWIGITNFEEEEREEARIKRAEAQRKRTKAEIERETKLAALRRENFDNEQKARDRQIALLQAEGKDVAILEQIKELSAIKQAKRDIEYAKGQIQRIRLLKRRLDGQSEEAKQFEQQIDAFNKAIRDSNQQIADSNNQLKINTINANKEKTKSYKKYVEDIKALDRQIQDAQLELQKDGLEKDLEENRIKFERQRQQIKGNGEKQKELRALLVDLELKAEQEIRKKYYEEEKSDKVELLNFVDETNKAEVEKEKAKNLAILDNAVETNKKIIESDKAVAQAKKDIQDAQIANVEAGIALFKDLAGENNKLQALAIAAENAVGIAKIIISTQAANAAAKLKYAAIPGGLALAAAEITANKISAGIGIAASVAAAAKGIASLRASAPLDSGGDLGGGGAGGGEVISPQFNVVGESGINQLAQLQQQPVQAYVVSGEVTTGQALDRNRVQNATL
jgi:hypothetical protein